MIQPVNNQILIEVIDEYAGLSHAGGEQQRGVVRAVSVSAFHLTASTGTVFSLNSEAFERQVAAVDEFIGKTVRYALYADADSTRFPEDGKQWVLIPWYRVLGVEVAE